MISVDLGKVSVGAFGSGVIRKLISKTYLEKTLEFPIIKKPDG